MMFKSDGQGGVTIPNWVLVIAPLLIAIITSTATVASMAANMKGDLGYLSNDFQQHKITSEKTLDNLEGRVYQCEIGTETIKKDIQYIKEKVDEINRKVESP